MNFTDKEKLILMKALMFYSQFVSYFSTDNELDSTVHDIMLKVSRNG